LALGCARSPERSADPQSAASSAIVVRPIASGAIASASATEPGPKEAVAKLLSAVPKDAQAVALRGPRTTMEPLDRVFEPIPKLIPRTLSKLVATTDLQVAAHVSNDVATSDSTMMVLWTDDAPIWRAAIAGAPGAGAPVKQKGGIATLEAPGGLGDFSDVFVQPGVVAVMWTRNLDAYIQMAGSGGLGFERGSFGATSDSIFDGWAHTDGGKVDEAIEEARITVTHSSADRVTHIRIALLPAKGAAARLVGAVRSIADEASKGAEPAAPVFKSAKVGEFAGGVAVDIDLSAADWDEIKHRF
jgi:hypothetical protein